MRHERKGVTTYLQTFILIAVALGGSLVAYREVSTIASASGGPLLRIWHARITQDSGVAFEELAISDPGQTSFPFLTLLNPGLRPDTYYCYSVSTTQGPVLVQTCPDMARDPTSVRVAYNITPGQTIELSIVLQGSTVFTPGSSFPFYVTAPGGAEADGLAVVEQG